MAELILLALACGSVAMAVALVGVVALYDRLLGRRERVYMDALRSASAHGYAAGEEACLAGRWGDATELELLTFRADASSRTRREVVEENCARAWASGWVRGFAAASRARVDVEFDAIAAEHAADGIARLEALANGEHSR